MDAYLTAAQLARIYHTPRPTIYRWASEDHWRRTRTRPTRYHTGDADTSYHKRHPETATSLAQPCDHGRS